MAAELPPDLGKLLAEVRDDEPTAFIFKLSIISHKDPVTRRVLGNETAGDRPSAIPVYNFEFPSLFHDVTLLFWGCNHPISFI